MRRLTFGALVAYILLFAGTVTAQVKYSNEFLNIGVNARVLGMGGAGVALIDDASAGYWNPARLQAMSTKLDAGLMHADYFAGLAKYDFGSVAYRIDKESVAGVSFIRFGVDDIPNTLELLDSDGNIRYDRIRTFSSSDMAVLFSYARKMPIDGLSIGGNVKIIYRHTGDFANAWGFGLDAGAAYSKNGWQFALMARDVSSTFNAWSYNTEKLEDVFLLTGNEIPTNSLEITMPRLILGVAKRFQISSDFSAAADIDLHFTLDGKRPVLLSLGFTGIDPYLGTEWVYRDWLALRLGIGQFQWVKGFNAKNELNMQPALGLGLKFKNIRFNYAITDLGDLAVAQYSNILSLHMAL